MGELIAPRMFCPIDCNGAAFVASARAYAASAVRNEATSWWWNSVACALSA
nr:hypothetical protein [Mycobacterium sp. Z3061]